MVSIAKWKKLQAIINKKSKKHWNVREVRCLALCRKFFIHKMCVHLCILFINIVVILWLVARKCYLPNETRREWNHNMHYMHAGECLMVSIETICFFLLHLFRLYSSIHRMTEDRRLKILWMKFGFTLSFVRCTYYVCNVYRHICGSQKHTHTHNYCVVIVQQSVAKQSHCKFSQWNHRTRSIQLWMKCEQTE